MVTNGKRAKQIREIEKRNSGTEADGERQVGYNR